MASASTSVILVSTPRYLYTTGTIVKESEMTLAQSTWLRSGTDIPCIPITPKVSDQLRDCNTFVPRISWSKTLRPGPFCLAAGAFSEQDSSRDSPGTACPDHLLPVACPRPRVHRHGLHPVHHVDLPGHPT